MTRRQQEDTHFVHQPELDILHQRPENTIRTCFSALLATAVFRIWPHLLFLGGWSTAIMLINHRTAAELSIPPTMLTVLGVLLGLTLSYRTSSAYERYWEGRRMWSQIVFGCRWWARAVWIHGPDSLVVAPPDGGWASPADEERDAVRATIEKKTMVNLALAFAVATKHYLRGEEGILYEDLYDLVKFIPGLNLPSGMPPRSEAYDHATRTRESADAKAASPTDSGDPDADSTYGIATSAISLQMLNRTASASTTWRPFLFPARDPPVFRWSETFPVRFFVMERQRRKREERQAAARQGKRAHKERARSYRHGQNIPSEVALFMSSYVAALQKRKTADVATINAMLLPLQQLNDALASLERILTTPIPFSYTAHIWEVTWLYVLILPFQLYSSGFGWVTVPATVVTAYILIGFVSIGEEIENPFGYDRNDLHLDFFTSQIIKPELDAITAKPFPAVEQWVFTAENDALFGAPDGVGADQLEQQPMSSLRQRLAANQRPVDVCGAPGRRTRASDV